MLNFSIELKTNATTVYRLQKDHKTWRLLSDYAFADTDLLTHDIYEIIRLQTVNDTISLQGVIYQVNRTSFSLFEEVPEAHFAVTVYRDEFPKTPSMEQLRSVIAQGDDTINNALILNVYGLFELRARETVNPMIEDPTIVGRYETFIAGNGYVGEDAASDNGHIERTYTDLLSVWAFHIKTGYTNADYDDDDPRNLEEIMSEIEEIRQSYPNVISESYE